MSVENFSSASSPNGGIPIEDTTGWPSLALNGLSSVKAMLPILLEAVGRNSGLLMLQAPGTPQPLWIDYNLPPGWASQLDQPGSPLRQAVQQVIEHDSSLPFEAGEEMLAGYQLEELAAIQPVRLPHAALGVLLVHGERLDAPATHTLRWMLATLGQALQASLERDQMQRRARQLAGLQGELTRLAFSIAGSDFDAVQAALLRGAAQVLDCEHSSLILVDEPNDGWMIGKSLNEHAEWVYQISPVAGPGLVRECLSSGEMICIDNPTLDARYEASSDGWGEHPVRSFLCAPLTLNGQAFGALKLLNHHVDCFGAYDQDLLALLAAHAANTIQGTHMLQQLKITNADLEANRWELLGSRNTLRAIFDHLPVGLYIIDPDYRLAAVNRSRAQRVGLPPRTLVGQVCYQVLFDRKDPCPECRVMESFRELRGTQRNERRYTGSEDTSDWEINTYPILDENEQAIQAILLEQDVTERRRLEAVLTQSEKLAAIGQLAAGVAHEINNPLTAIIANAQILHRELPPESDLQESVDLIARAGARATQVVRNLLDFARKEEYHLGLTDLNETVERALELVQHEILARGIHLEFAPDPDLPPMLASQDHLQSVWLNLLLNAIDSLDKPTSEIKIVTRRLGSEIYVSFADNGKGIPPDKLTRIFEPFYTTKAPGRGTGLGLSVSHRIVKQHGGRIGIESQVGAGSTFTVMLPAS